MKVISIVIVTLLGFVNVAIAQQEFEEAPLEDVWPALAVAQLAEIRLEGVSPLVATGKHETHQDFFSVHLEVLSERRHAPA